MRACATANAVVLGLGLSALAFAACSSGQAPSPPPASPPASTSAPEIATTTEAPIAAAPKPKAPVTAADCKQVMSDLVNPPPDGGVVMNNAMTAGDAGHSDRFLPMADLIKSRNDGYRCCFDLWARKHPEAAGREVPIKVQWVLKPDGTLVSATIDAAESQLDDPEVGSCMVDLSKGLTYPPSPSGKETRFGYKFLYKVRH